MTVTKLQKILTELIAKGHGRKPVLINKPTFSSPLESDGCVMLGISGVQGPEWICTADDDGGAKFNSDGTEAGKMAVILFGAMHDA